MGRDEADGIGMGLNGERRGRGAAAGAVARETASEHLRLFSAASLMTSWKSYSINASEPTSKLSAKFFTAL